MKIVIVGCGKVGFAIAKQLNSEGYDITVIDKSVSVINNVINVLDVETIVGSGADYDVLKAAKVEHAELLIAAASNDELNILACLIAHKFGTAHTIARVRNPEYISALSLLKDDLSLSLSINPEMAAAREIAKNLSFPSQIKVSSFANGKMELAEIKIMGDAPILGQQVLGINSSLKTNVLFCAIERNGEIIIPGGATVFKEGDKVSFTGSTKEIEFFIKKIGVKRRRPLREIMIVGGGKTTFYLTRMLLDMGLDVKVIERNRKRCLELVEAFPEATIIHGDGTDHEFLMSESLAEMDAFVALTDNDEENVIVSMFAREKGVLRVIPKVNRVSLGFVLEKLGLENAITPKNITANQIVQYVRAMQNSLGSNVESLMKIIDGKVEILEFRVRENCKFIGKPLKDLHIKDGILFCYITHKGKTNVAKGDSFVSQGDTVMIISLLQGLRDINDVLDQ